MKNAGKELTVVDYSAAAVKVLQYHFEPHQLCFRTHWHDRIEFLLINEGQMHIEHGVYDLCAAAGDLVIIPPKVSHKGYTRDCSLDYNVLMFDLRSFYNETQICQRLLPALYDGTIKLKNLTSDPQTVGCCRQIIHCQNKGSLEMTALIYRFLYHLTQNELSAVQQPADSSAIKEAINFIEENYHKELSVAKISSEFGYSAPYFCRKFKATTGLSPSTYLKVFRLEQAYKMLKRSSANISEISIACGFSDPNYFTRCFKDHFGFPPSKCKVF